MAASLVFSLALPSLAAFSIKIEFGALPSTLNVGEPVTVTAIVNTVSTDDSVPKSSKYTFQWNSSNPAVKVTPVDGATFPTATLQLEDTFGNNKQATITLFVMDTANGNISSKATFDVTLNPPEPIHHIKITPVPSNTQQIYPVRVRDTLSLKAVAYYDEFEQKVANVPATWETSAPGIATVSNRGLVTGVVKGNAQITVTCKDKSETVTVQVVDAFSVSFTGQDGKPITSIELKPDVGTATLTAEVRPNETIDNMSQQPVTWTSSDTEIATVTPDTANNKNATIKAGSKSGTATIRATVQDPASGLSTAASCVVTVLAPSLSLQTVEIKERQDDIPTLVVGSNAETKLTASLTYFNTDTNKEVTIPATNETVEWTSSNPKVATVWSDGTVRAVGGGTTTITVKSKNPIAGSTSTPPKYATDTRTITVNQNLKRITLSNTSQELKITKTLVNNVEKTDFEKFNLSVLHDPETAWPQINPFTITTDKPNIVKIEDAVDEDGKKIENTWTITAASVGEVFLTVSGELNGKKETATCRVNVTKPVTGITLSDETVSLKKGETKQLTATLLPKGEVTGTITWLTSDNRYVRVDNTGKITAVEYTDKPVTITARVGQSPGQVFTATCKVTVGTTSVSKVTITGLQAEGPKTASVSLGSSLQLSAVVEPKTATDTELIWSSSDENYATVNRNGKVTPQRKTEAGKPVIITVKSKQNDKAFDTVAVTVTAHKVTGVRIEPADPVTLDKVGDTQQFVGSLVPSTADDTLLWTVSGGTASSDGNTISNNVLSLKSGGSNKVVIVTGLAPGETDVIVKVGDFTTNTKVTVSGITFEKSSISVAVGRSEPIVKTLYGRAKTLNAKDWEWSSDNDSVARVNPSTGMVSGIKPGTAKITCKNGNYSAEIPVTVSESSATVLSYKMGDDGQYGFDTKILGDIRNQCKTAFDGSDLNYVTNLSVAPSQGTLYYGYVSETNPGQGVAASDRFYYKTSATGTARPEDAYRYTTGKPLDKLLKDVTFIPAAGFSGKADISYTAFAENGKDLAGSIQITVPTASEITYNSPNGEAVHFVTNDFSTLSQTTSGYPISSVRFNAPSERYGYLYYEYSGGDVYGSNINSGQRFYASSTPSLESVAFVPRAGYTGTFPITFTGWNTNGSSFTGTIRITVKTTGEGGGDISYTTLSGSRVYFDASDFQALCRTATGGKLNYIQFTALPTASGSSSSSSAVLYHGSGSGSRVGTSASIYVSSSGSRWTIDNVYLLPSSSYTGQVTIPFKGWDTDRKTFEGTIVVDVTKDGGTAATIYMTCNGMPLVFRRADFDDACKDALPAALKSVRFKLPGRNSGTLYERFKDLNDRKPLAANQDIPAADLVTLSFLPKGESSGTVYLSYTATDEKGNVCDGQVRITAEPNPVSLYFTDLDNTVWAIPSINFLRTYDVVKGKGKKRFQPNDTLKRGDFVLMLARAFNFQLNGSASFPDVPRNSYYAGAIAAAKSLGLIKGSGQNGSFRPEAEITRQEAATILFRVLQREQNLSAADLGYLTSYSDSGQIDTYAQTALATLIRDGVFEGSGGRLYPYSPLTRAQMAVILHRAIT